MSPQAQPAPAGPKPASERLPTGLWVGTAAFVLLAAGLLAVSIHIGRRAIVGSGDRQIERQALEPHETSR